MSPKGTQYSLCFISGSYLGCIGIETIFCGQPNRSWLLHLLPLWSKQQLIGLTGCYVTLKGQQLIYVKREIITSCIPTITILAFGMTYLWEMTFSKLKDAKFAYVSTDEHLQLILMTRSTNF